MNAATETTTYTDTQLVHDVPSHLFDPKTKMTAKLRKSYRASMSRNIATPKPPIANAIKTARKLSALPLAKVFRRLKQSARRAASSRNLLGNLSPVSIFRAPIEREQDRQLSILRQVIAEIQYREERARV
jgi:hypothetical protein